MRLARSGVLGLTVAGLVTALSLLGGPAQAAPAAPAAPARAGTLTSTVTGTFTDAQGGQGTFQGTFVPHRFVKSGTQATARGTLTGTLTDSTGAVLGRVNRSTALALADANAPAAAAAASCTILDLVLAPLDLNLLGLQVHLNQVVLHIVAQSGPGQLLGNLLCAVVGLLDGGGSLSGLLTALNQILALLGLLG